jgi:toxin ParE1/3/4
MRRLEIADAARHDLREISDFTERNWGSAQRQRYLSAIHRAFVRLRDGTAVGRRRDDVGAGFCSVGVGRHVIFYRETEDALVVLRILHDRMDVHRHLDQGQ